MREHDIRTIPGIWGWCKEILSPSQQARVRRRVVDRDWSLKKAVENEGVIFCRTKLDLSVVKEMFESGELTVEEPEKPQEEVPAAQPQGDEFFVPRPKPHIPDLPQLRPKPTEPEKPKPEEKEPKEPREEKPVTPRPKPEKK